MGRIQIKGGVWKNTEDEILKAAVMKYGKNQWSRIASLLQRKSSKQCKARWFEWLDPSIKKTEWSRDEEEKLLHLAKLMPTQWRTIAPIIGRTAAQCLDHYEKLLDQAQAQDGEYDAFNDPRRLRPGEIDPNPHTKPARPDQVDMDEDEKEMLSEARARLANTQGKKAKRKAREKSLEEARRLASLQKRRELRAAGIETFKKKKRQRGVDYNAEIPFEKKAPTGFFDPSKDGEYRSKEFKRMNLEDATGGPRRDKVEKQNRRDDDKKHAEQQKKDMPRAVKQMNKIRDDAPQRKRSKLVLPKPQTTDAELEELVKMGQQSQDLAGNADQGANLLQDYSSTPAASLSARTPRAAATEDPILREAQNIIALNRTESVLAGGENTPLFEGGGSFRGMTPDSSKLATPNTVLSTPFRGASVGSTPGRTPQELGSTPLRDKLSINEEADSSLLTPRTQSERHRQQQMQEDLRNGLQSLPAPNANFDIVVPELDPDDEDVSARKDGYVQDAADVDAEDLKQAKADEETRMRKRSQVIQRGLPIPKKANTAIMRTSAPQTTEHVADEAIKTEMLEMIRYDKDMPTTRTYDAFEEEDIASAKEMLGAEMLVVRQAMGHTDVEDSYGQLWADTQEEVIFLASTDKYGRASRAPQKDKLDLLETEMKSIRKQMTKAVKKSVKIEEKRKKLTGGYQKRANKQVASIKQLTNEIETCSLQHEAFTKLREAELQALPVRMEKLQGEVDAQKSREEGLQKRFSDLLAARDAAYAKAQAATAVAATKSAAPIKA